MSTTTKTSRTDRHSRRIAAGQATIQKAVTGQSMANYGPIIEGFMEKGIPESDIQPRVNVFTFNAWQALGRSVKKGEKGVRVCTMSTSESKDGDETETRRHFTHATVFHISQTEPNK